jgi:hypothetical protein
LFTTITTWVDPKRVSENAVIIADVEPPDRPVMARATRRTGIFLINGTLSILMSNLLVLIFLGNQLSKGILPQKAKGTLLPAILSRQSSPKRCNQRLILDMAALSALKDDNLLHLSVVHF